MQWNFYRVCKDHLQVEVVMLNLQSNIKRVKVAEWAFCNMECFCLWL